MRIRDDERWKKEGNKRTMGGGRKRKGMRGEKKEHEGKEVEEEEENEDKGREKEEENEEM
jgi:hypothetical protein